MTKNHSNSKFQNYETFFKPNFKKFKLGIRLVLVIKSLVLIITPIDNTKL